MTNEQKPERATTRTPHILNTASNLLGFCLIVQTSLRISGSLEISLIDEFTGGASVLLMGACLLSFISMRTRFAERSERWERYADVTFIGALVIMFTIIVLIAFNLPAVSRH